MGAIYMKNMKYLAVDYGDVRTGLAVSDITGFLASGIGCIQGKGMRGTAEKVAITASEQGAVGIIVGLPKNMDGSEGFRADTVKAFVSILSEYTELPIELYDERLTTVEAHDYLSATNVRGKKRKQTVDTLSAQILLQDWLDSKKC
jgi:putative Holliday junction resolvase